MERLQLAQNFAARILSKGPGTRKVQQATSGKRLNRDELNKRLEEQGRTVMYNKRSGSRKLKTSHLSPREAHTPSYPAGLKATEPKTECGHGEHTEPETETRPSGKPP